MKKTDIALIIIIISISAGIAYWVASVTIGKGNDKPIVVRTAEPINVDEVTVDKNVFSKDGINPTVETTISGEDLTSFVGSGTSTDGSTQDQSTGDNTGAGATTETPSSQVIDESSVPSGTPIPQADGANLQSGG